MERDDFDVRIAYYPNLLSQKLPEGFFNERGEWCWVKAFRFRLDDGLGERTPEWVTDPGRAPPSSRNPW